MPKWNLFVQAYKSEAPSNMETKLAIYTVCGMVEVRGRKERKPVCVMKVMILGSRKFKSYISGKFWRVI
jgi:hypothetical protein